MAGRSEEWKREVKVSLGEHPFVVLEVVRLLFTLYNAASGLTTEIVIENKYLPVLSVPRQ